jgi:hypothetical protein
MLHSFQIVMHHLPKTKIICISHLKAQILHINCSNVDVDYKIYRENYNLITLKSSTMKSHFMNLLERNIVLK